MILPPRVDTHDGILVVRDDELEGGTKVRALVQVLAGPVEEWVYAGPAVGHAQLALAVACEHLGKRSTLFVAQRNELHPLTRRARGHGLKVVQVPHGRMSNVRAKARDYCALTGAQLLPLGIATPAMEDALAAVARRLDVDPLEVWVAAGTGTLSRALARAWPAAQLHAVRVGMQPQLPTGARMHVAPEAFASAAKQPPPFPSASSYDAKVWRFAAAEARRDGRALLWNVAGD